MTDRTEEDVVPHMLTVYFDGACPVCSREIGVYRRSRGAEKVLWRDIHSSTFEETDDLDREGALARFHVRRADGKLVDGAAAFLELWAQLPAWRWLAVVTRPRAVQKLLEYAYAGFLAWRRLRR